VASDPFPSDPCDDDDVGITTGQFHALVDAETSKPISEPPVSPRADFLYSPEVKKLVETQRTARAKLNEMILMLHPAKR
jgi:hypothetical protein